MKTRILFLLLATYMALSLAVPVRAAETAPYQITLESCTEERVSVRFSPLSEERDHLLFLASYTGTGRMLGCTAAASDSETLTLPYSSEVSYVKAFVLDSAVFTPVQNVQTFGDLAPKPPTVSALTLRVNGEPLAVTWEDNASVDALRELAQSKPVSVPMAKHGGFEQFGPLGSSLPRNDTGITTEPGDVILYSGNQIVLFYGSNTWSYTRLGRIEGMSQAQLSNLLGGDPVTVTISME